jgi:hypothetical protein
MVPVGFFQQRWTYHIDWIMDVADNDPFDDQKPPPNLYKDVITCQERVAPAACPSALNTGHWQLASLSITLFTALRMEPSVGSKKPIYGMLMTVLFYTTGILCGLRTALWLAMHTLLPAISHIIALYYRPYSSSDPAPPGPTAGGMSSNARKGATAGQFFKLVHTAAGHDVLVPVPIPTSTYHISAVATAGSSSNAPIQTFVRLALLSSLIGAAYYYFVSYQEPLHFFCLLTLLYRSQHG